MSTSGGIVSGDPEVFSPGSVGSDSTSELPILSEPVIPPVLEVWFAGCHCDVGGGAVEDRATYKLADIPLRWMVEQVMLSRCGIRFDGAALKNIGVEVSTIPPVIPIILTAGEESEANVGAALPTPQGSQSSPDGSEECFVQNERPRIVKERTCYREQDIRTDIHDRLKCKRWWWFLEFLPMMFTWQEADGEWKSKWG